MPASCCLGLAWVLGPSCPKAHGVLGAPEPLAGRGAGLASLWHIFGGNWSQRGLRPGPVYLVPHSGRLFSIQRGPFLISLFHTYGQGKAVKSDAVLASVLRRTEQILSCYRLPGLLHADHTNGSNQLPPASPCCLQMFSCCILGQVTLSLECHLPAYSALLKQRGRGGGNWMCVAHTPGRVQFPGLKGPTRSCHPCPRWGCEALDTSGTHLDAALGRCGLCASGPVNTSRLSGGPCHVAGCPVPKGSGHSCLSLICSREWLCQPPSGGVRVSVVLLLQRALGEAWVQRPFLPGLQRADGPGRWEKGLVPSSSAEHDLKGPGH